MLWRCYVNDVFAIAENHNLPLILQTANSVCPAILFTIEHEVDHCLHFLNIHIKGKYDAFHQNIFNSVYRKNASSGQYLNSNPKNIGDQTRSESSFLIRSLSLKHY